MFWRLGFISAWRNTSRSLLAILSMALAAGFLTNAISLSRGYVGRYREAYRGIHGGEIAVYGMQLEGTAGNDEELIFTALSGVENTDLDAVMPQLFNGYMAPTSSSAPITPQQLEIMANIAGISGVYPRYQMPAMSSGSSTLRYTPLRGRDYDLDNKLSFHPGNLITAGRWFNPADEGQNVAVVLERRGVLSGEDTASLGEDLQLVVPRIRYGEGTILYDYDDPLLVTLRIIGVVDVPLRHEDYSSVSNSGQRVGLSITFYLNTSEVQLPLTTWQRIWQEAGGQEYLPQQVALMVDDMSYLEDIALMVRVGFRDYTVLSVPELLANAEGTYLLENPEILFAVPQVASAFAPRGAATQRGMATDLRLPLSILIFTNAALVIAANLLIMVNERRAEIGILKAVGSRRIEIMQMILSEAMLTSLLGAFWGFAFFRVPGILNQLTNRVPLDSLIGSITMDLAFVFGVTATASLLFGLLPAMAMGNLSVREVLQTE